jgi:hypothetical protein
VVADQNARKLGWRARGRHPYTYTAQQDPRPTPADAHGTPHVDAPDAVVPPDFQHYTRGIDDKE